MTLQGCGEQAALSEPGSKGSQQYSKPLSKANLRTCEHKFEQLYASYYPCSSNGIRVCLSDANTLSGIFCL
jgi:hypothetical protein